jgi:hypothetical protein
MPNIKVSALDEILPVDVLSTDLWMLTRDGINNFKMTHSNLLSLLSSPILVGQTLFVDPTFGNDATALRERQDKPFQSVDAAILAAQYGDTVKLLAGSHFVFANVGKDGIKIDGETGSEVYCFTTLMNFDTTIGGVALTTMFEWTGHTRIMQCTGNLINVKSNPSANVLLEFDSVQVNNISNGILAQDGFISIVVREKYTCAGRNFSTRLSGNLKAVIGGEVTSTFVNVSNGNFWISGTSWTGKANIKAKSFVIPSNVVAGFSCHIYCDNLIGSDLSIELDELIDTSNVAQGAIRINGAFTNTGSKIRIKIGKVSTVRPLFGCTNSTMNMQLEIDDCESGTSVMAAGNLLIKNSLLKKLTGCPVQNLGGTLSLMSTTLVSDGIATSLDNSAGVVLSEGSKGNIAPTLPVTGNFYVNPLYTN